jgi:hypothetical protein
VRVVMTTTTRLKKIVSQEGDGSCGSRPFFTDDVDKVKATALPGTVQGDQEGQGRAVSAGIFMVTMLYLRYSLCSQRNHESSDSKQNQTSMTQKKS